MGAIDKLIQDSARAASSLQESERRTAEKLKSQNTKMEDKVVVG